MAVPAGPDPRARRPDRIARDRPGPPRAAARPAPRPRPEDEYGEYKDEYGDEGEYGDVQNMTNIVDPWPLPVGRPHRPSPSGPDRPAVPPDRFRGNPVGPGRAVPVGPGWTLPSGAVTGRAAPSRRAHVAMPGTRRGPRPIRPIPVSGPRPPFAGGVQGDSRARRQAADESEGLDVGRVLPPSGHQTWLVESTPGEAPAVKSTASDAASETAADKMVPGPDRGLAGLQLDHPLFLGLGLLDLGPGHLGVSDFFCVVCLCFE